MNVTVLMAEADSIDTAHNRVVLRDGDAIGFDTLLLATGATHAYFGHDAWVAHGQD